MPNLTFVLPHWLYWLGLIVFPLVAMALLKARARKAAHPSLSLPVAWFLLLTGGFVGLHRFYLRSLLGWVFVPLFIAILLFNVEGREARNAVSRTSNEISSASFLLERAQHKAVEEGIDNRDEINREQQALETARRAEVQARARAAKWSNLSAGAAALIALLLLVDACLLPRLLRRCIELEKSRPRADKLINVSCDVDIEAEVDGRHYANHTKGIHTRFVDAVDHINEFTGKLVAYWSIIAVFVYYYEVMARYVFNSPTNWAHESMFLMFGMQYLLAGGYVLRNNGHVRVDVFYMNFSPLLKAKTDIATSVFFFLFTGVLAWTGWLFFMDAFSVGEVSFTEWAIQYWPVKFAIPLGATLLLLQGLAWLIKDILLLLDHKKQEA